MSASAARQRLLRYLKRGNAITRDWSDSLGVRWTPATRPEAHRAFDTEAAEKLSMKGARVNGVRCELKLIAGTLSTYALGPVDVGALA